MNFPNKTASYYYKISIIVFFLGSPNFYINHLNVSKTFYKMCRIISKCLNATLPFFIVFELGAFVTQTNLTKKQESDLLIYGISHPILWAYSLILWNRHKEIKDLFSHILRLKSIYNDEMVEVMMIKKANRDSTALALSCILALISHSVSAFLELIKSEGTFTTVITTWPLVDDPSYEAGAVRIICYVMWWLLVSRIIASYIIIIGLTTSMSFQYVNLQSYFYSLDSIFEKNSLNQKEKELKYENSFKLGVKMHTNTIECIEKFRNICQNIFSAQIIFVITILVFLMTQMMKSERTMANAAATAITAISVLIGTGFILWNAGDITVEASQLPTSMYLSGWHNCQRNSSPGIRKMVVISMIYAQKPVIIKGLGIVHLSYRAYLTLVKTSYSVFSVIY